MTDLGGSIAYGYGSSSGTYSAGYPEPLYAALKDGALYFDLV
jgi:hypothetical protein